MLNVGCFGGIFFLRGDWLECSYGLCLSDVVDIWEYWDWLVEDRVIVCLSYVYSIFILYLSYIYPMFIVCCS
jgi:hypothetical protein